MAYSSVSDHVVAARLHDVGVRDETSGQHLSVVTTRMALDR